MVGPEGTRHICQSLRTNISLLRMDLGWNMVGRMGSRYVAELLGLNTTLLEINLMGNSLGTAGLTLLSQGINMNKHRSLKQLTLSYNSVADESLYQVIDALNN